MKTLKRFGLAQRILFGWMTQTILIIGLFSVAMHESTELMEDNLVSDILKDELSILVSEIEEGEDVTLPSSMQFYGNAPQLEPVPDKYALFPDGYQEIVGSTDSSFLYKITVNGHPYVLIRDQYDFERSEQFFKIMICTCATLIFLFCVGFGYWWIRKKIMAPIESLSNEVRQMADSQQYKSLAGEITDDEIGELAKTCDQALKRFHEALSREKLFTSDISHELRTPLTIIQTTAELMQLYPLTEKQTEQVNKILKAAQSMEELLSVFLQLARGTEFEKTAHTDRLHDVLQESYEHWGKTALAKNIKLSLQSVATCPGYFSPVLLGTVVNNLVKNAVFYTDKGEVTIRELENGFEVIDTGIGIPQEMKERIFMPKVRATDKAPGSGMGLSNAKRICERSGWRLDLIESKQGSHFRVSLIPETPILHIDQRQQ